MSRKTNNLRKRNIELERRAARLQQTIDNQKRLLQMIRQELAVRANIEKQKYASILSSETERRDRYEYRFSCSVDIRALVIMADRSGAMADDIQTLREMAEHHYASRMAFIFSDHIRKALDQVRNGEFPPHVLSAVKLDEFTVL